MKRFSEQLKRKSETVKMTVAERRELKDRLVAYMEYHPLPSTMEKTVPKDTIASEPFTVLNVSFVQFRGVLTMLTLFFVIIVPFAAEYTVPGDVLYPVKVKFNEEVRSTLTLSPYEKVEWETERLERRLAEARLLASEGKLTDEVQAEVALAVKEHSDAAQAEIAVLRAEDSEEAAIAEIAFASALEVQSEALEATAETEEANTGASSTVLAIVDAVEEVQAAVATTETEVSHATLLARVELETTRAYELFATIRPNSTAAEQIEIERRLSAIEAKIGEAIALETPVTPAEEVITDVATSTDEVIEDVVTEGASSTETVASSTEAVTEVAAPDVVANPEAADELLRAALSDLQKLITFMTDIEIKTHVSIDELLPVAPPAGESIISINLALADFEERLVVLVVDETADAKFALGVAEVTANLETIVAERDAENYEAAQTTVATTGALLADLELMAIQAIEEVVRSEEVIETDETATSTDPVLDEESAVGDPDTTDPEPTGEEEPITAEPATSTEAIPTEETTV